MQPKMTHIAKQVSSLDETIAFYQSFCGLTLVHERKDDQGVRQVAWLAEPGKEEQFVFVFINGTGPGKQAAKDYSHIGFALASKTDVDAIAKRAETAGCLAWPITEEPPPVGYYCGVRDPEGQIVEFSYGQPLGDPL